MSCCGHNEDTGRFFSWMAGSSRKRFEKKGFEQSQKFLLEGLQQAGYQGASVLEIGSGAGNFHQTLLLNGADRATGVDLAPRMLDQARAWARDRQLESRVEYRLGDFVELAAAIEPVDVTVLDKVVCCYPDAESLVLKSLEKTRRVYALTFPRNTWINRSLSKLMGKIFWLFRCNYRNYVHHPDKIESWITGAGFRRLTRNQTLVWQSEVYVRG